MKICKVCGEDKDESEFYSQKHEPTGKSYTHGACKLCYGHKVRLNHLMRNYGLTESDYNALLTAQDGGCAICKRIDNVYADKKGRWLAVDHDHETNEIRGLLCQTCNRMIGLAKDSLEVMESAVRYLS